MNAGENNRLNKLILMLASSDPELAVECGDYCVDIYNDCSNGCVNETAQCGFQCTSELTECLFY